MKKILAVLAASAALVACGGGGGGDTAADQLPGGGSGGVAAKSTVEGFWRNTAPSGESATLVILENGETWGAFTTSNAIVGALYGQTISDASTLSGSGTEFEIGGTATPINYSGTFTSERTMTFTNPTGLDGAPLTFGVAYGDDYKEPASVAVAEGKFSGAGGVSVTVRAAGDLGLLTVDFTSPDCYATGSIVPRASGKNVFDATVTFTGRGCALGDKTTTKGIAYYNADTQDLLMLALNPAKDNGFIYIGSK